LKSTPSEEGGEEEGEEWGGRGSGTGRKRKERIKVEIFRINSEIVSG